MSKNEASLDQRASRQYRDNDRVNERSMVSDQPDAFVQFATERGLRLAWADVNAAPRDVTASPDELERYAIVTVTGSGPDMSPLQTLFITDQADPRSPSMRDVLWWLSSDSWAIERSGRELNHWANVYGYPVESPATARTFHLHIAQADGLKTLLGPDAYHELLSLYQAELRNR